MINSLIKEKNTIKIVFCYKILKFRMVSKRKQLKRKYSRQKKHLKRMRKKERIENNEIKIKTNKKDKNIFSVNHLFDKNMSYLLSEISNLSLT
jgi:hypothetical protein